MNDKPMTATEVREQEAFNLLLEVAEDAAALIEAHYDNPDSGYYDDGALLQRARDIREAVSIIKGRFQNPHMPPPAKPQSIP